MDVESAKTIADALAQAKTDVEAVGMRLIGLANAALNQFAAEAIADGLVAAGQLLKEANADATALVASLDGYTLELDPPIVIRAVRLSKPKAGA